jgi:hypothetical protein
VKTKGAKKALRVYCTLKNLGTYNNVVQAMSSTRSSLIGE